MINFAENFYKILKEKNITLKELCCLLHETYPYIKNCVENNLIPIKKLIDISIFLETDIAEFFKEN